MKRFIVMTALAAVVACPSMAQDWVGQPVTPTLINNLPGGVDYTPSTGGAAVSTVTTTVLACVGITAPHAPPCGPGERYDIMSLSHYGNGQLTGSTVDRVYSLPAAAFGADSAVGIPVSGPYRDPNSPSGVSLLQASVPISAFATASSVAGVQTSINGLDARITALEGQSSGSTAALNALTGRVDTIDGRLTGIDTRLTGMDARLSAIESTQATILANQQAYSTALWTAHQEMVNGVALASSLSLLGPAQGMHNRLGIGTSSYGGAGAVSLNYTHASGRYDFGAAAAVARGDTLAKASFGVSW